MILSPVFSYSDYFSLQASLTPWSCMPFLHPPICKTPPMCSGFLHCRSSCLVVAEPEIYLSSLFFLLFKKTSKKIFWPCRTDCGISVPQPGMEPGPQPWQCRILTSRPPGNSFRSLFNTICKVAFEISFFFFFFFNLSNHRIIAFRTSLVAQWLRVCLPCRGHEVKPWSGKIPHAAEQLSPCATTTEPAL